MTTASIAALKRGAGAGDDLLLLAAIVYLVPLAIVAVALPIAAVAWVVRAVAMRF